VSNLVPLTIAMAIIVFAGFTQGLTSFGFALIAMPFLSQIIPLNQAVPIVVFLSLCTNLLVIANCYRFIKIKRIWIMVVSSLIAAPFGAWLLVYVDADILKLVTGLIIIAFALALLFGKSFPIRDERLAFIPVGLLSGLLNGSISMSGPPVALFLSNQNTDKGTFRANITFYAIILNIITLFTFFLNHLITKEVAAYGVNLVPAMLVGVFLGIIATRKLDERVFKNVALMLIILSGIWTVFNALF
jgi:uncharacterized protein